MRRTRILSVAIAAAGAVLLGGCLMGPDYQRPAISTPTVYRGAPPEPRTGVAGSIGDEKWVDLFQDPVLRQLEQQALQRNYDIRIAATRVLEAQQEAGIVRAAEFPEVNANADAITQRNPKIASAINGYSTRFGELNLSVLWNLDFWGRYRRTTEAARDQWLATQWGQREVVSSVVAQVASGYFQLRQLDDALALAHKALAARQDSLRLTNILEQHGSASQLDVSQAQELVSQAGETIPDLERQIAQQENAISTLTGANPGVVPRGAALEAQPNPPAVPPGLTSEILERRPDVRQAEAALMAANAEIGVARAAMFPNISLTGDGGLESFALNHLFTSAGRQWNFGADLVQPVFAAGSLHAAVRLTEAEKQQMLLTYGQTVQQAFRQVSDSLAALQRDHEFRQQQQTLTESAEKAEQLSNLLYRHGGGSFLQVLVAETNSFSAQLNLSQAELNERLALVQLYNALGGGWQ